MMHFSQKPVCRYRQCTSLRAAVLPVCCLILLAALSACVPAAIVGGGAATANVLAKDQTVGSTIDDITIETKINKKFFDKDFNDLFTNVDVDVIERRVFLTGSVNAVETAIEAVNLAWQVEGVNEVVNELQVEGATNLQNTAQDTWIHAQVNAKLMFTKGVGYANYSIEVVNGVVYLMGVAENEAEIRRVADIASRVPHVKKVISHIILKDDPRRRPYRG